MTQPVLSYVALISRDVSAACRLLGEVLGLPRTSCQTEDGAVPMFAVGKAALVLFQPHDRSVDGAMRTGVHHIGLHYADPVPPIAVRTEVQLGLDGTPRRAFDPGQTLGVRSVLTRPLVQSGGYSPFIERIDHVGVACADNLAALAVFNGQMGLPVESQQTDVEVETAIETFTSDRHGVVYHARAPRVVGGLRVAFLTAGDCELEFLQNFDPSHGADIQSGAAGNTRQDQGAITKFISTYGPGLHHVALKTPDIDATLARLDHAGARMIDRVGRPGSRRARIGFVHPASFGGFLLHLVQRDARRE